jgi:hypothetical protein
MKELGGIPHCLDLIQSSIDYYSHIQPLLSDAMVEGGIRQHGRMLAPLYESMVGEVIICSGFTSTSADRNLMISRFIDGEHSLPFEMSLRPGDVAALSPGFTVDEVKWIQLRCKTDSGFDEVRLPQGRLV